MKYEIAQQLKTGEYEHPRNKNIAIKRYEWIVTATGLTWQAARAQRKSLKGARIYPIREADTAIVIPVVA